MDEKISIINGFMKKAITYVSHEDLEKELIVKVHIPSLIKYLQPYTSYTMTPALLTGLIKHFWTFDVDGDFMVFSDSAKSLIWDTIFYKLAR